MHADIGDRAPAGEHGVGQPDALRIVVPEGELGAGEYRRSNLAFGYSPPQSSGAFLKPKNLRDPQEQPGLARCFHHLAALGGMDTHRLLAKHGLAVSERSEYVCQMQRVRSRYQHSVDLGRATEVRFRS